MNKHIPSGRLQTVLDLIPRGGAHPRTVREIATTTGLSPRTVDGCINILLMDYGIPIGGVRGKDRHGVYIITTESEREETLTAITHNAQSLGHRIAKLESIKIAPD